MPSRRTTTNAVLIAVAGLVLAGTVAAAQDDAPSASGPTPAVVSTTVWVEGGQASTAAGAGTTGASNQAAEAARAAEDKAAAARAEAAAAKAAAAKAKEAAAQKASSARAAAQTWAVTKVVDGDTIWASRDGISRKVRLIGIDTPESGECGFTESTRNLRGIIGGQRVTLTAGAQDDVDQYGRLLRYVDVGGVDAGLRQIKKGYAVARYDSRDGYGAHARETAYVRADAGSPKAACAEPSTGGTSGDTSGGSSGTWPLAGDRYPCPQSRPVKGNEDSMIAHEPGDRYYSVTNPEQCFATMSDAEAAGFRPAKV